MEDEDGFKLSTREELAQLVHSFHEVVGRDITQEELFALDFAMEWTFETAESDHAKGMQPEYGVIHGMLPQLHMTNGLTLSEAEKIAQALQGQVRVRYLSKWVKYEAP